MTAVSKNVYKDKLGDIVDKYNTYHRTIKMKPINVKSGVYTDYNVDANAKNTKFKTGDDVRISSIKMSLLKKFVQSFCD